MDPLLEQFQQLEREIALDDERIRNYEALGEAMTDAERLQKADASHRESRAWGEAYDKASENQGWRTPLGWIRELAGLGGNVGGAVVGTGAGAPTGPGAIVTGAAGGVVGGALARQGVDNAASALGIRPMDTDVMELALERNDPSIITGRQQPGPGEIFDRDFGNMGVDAAGGLVGGAAAAGVNKLMPYAKRLGSSVWDLVKGADEGIDKAAGAVADTVGNVRGVLRGDPEFVDPLEQKAVDIAKSQGDSGFWIPGRKAAAVQAVKDATDDPRILMDVIGGQMGKGVGRTAYDDKLAENFMEKADDILETGIIQRYGESAAAGNKGAMRDMVEEIGGRQQQLMEQRLALVQEAEAAGVKISEQEVVGHISTTGPTKFNSLEGATRTLQVDNPLADVTGFIERLRLNSNFPQLAKIANVLEGTLTGLKADLAAGSTPTQLLGRIENMNYIRRVIEKEFDSTTTRLLRQGDQAKMEATLRAVKSVQRAMQDALERKVGGGEISALNKEYGALEALQDLAERFVTDTGRSLGKGDARRMVQTGMEHGMPTSRSGWLSVGGKKAFGSSSATHALHDAANREANALKTMNDFLEARALRDAGAPGKSQLMGYPRPVVGPRFTNTMEQANRDVQAMTPGMSITPRALQVGAIALGDDMLPAMLPEAKAAEAEPRLPTHLYADGSVSVNGVPVTQAQVVDRFPSQPKIPRDVNMLDVPTLGVILQKAGMEPWNIQPVAQQAQQIFASGDKKAMGQFIGALARRYPQIPFEKGPVTGMPSEVRIDGGTYLMDPMDMQAWEEQINKSSLREDEKAQRVLSLRKYNQVMPMQAPIAAPLYRQDQDESRNPDSPMFQFAPRQNSIFGSRRVQ